MVLNFEGQDLLMLLKMVERGWSDGDLAEYLTADQGVACMSVLDTLGIPLTTANRRAAGRTSPQFAAGAAKGLTKP